MNATYANIRDGRWARSAWFVVPAVLVILGTSGITVRPVLGRRAALRELALAQERSTLREREFARAQRFEAQRGSERVEATIRELTEILPRTVTAVDYSALMSLIAARRELRLANVSLAPTSNASFPDIEDRVLCQDSEIRGHGSLANIARAVDDLRAAGLVVAVHEFRATRREVTDAGFDFQVTLGVYRRAAVPPADPTSERGT